MNKKNINKYEFDKLLSYYRKTTNVKSHVVTVCEPVVVEYYEDTGKKSVDQERILLLMYTAYDKDNPEEYYKVEYSNILE